MNWRDEVDGRRGLPQNDAPIFRRMGPASGRLATMTATWILYWADGQFRIYRRRPEDGPCASAQLVGRFSLRVLAAEQRAQMGDWEAVEWLCFLEGALPLD
jgi:hypothetical protein